MYTGSDIKKTRSKLEITQKEFAMILNVSLPTIRNWEQHPNFKIKKKYEAILTPLIQDQIAVQSETVKNEFMAKMKKFLRILPFGMANNVMAVYYCGIDPKTSKWAKAIALAALVYFINPIDVIPDFIPITGFLDDAAMIAGAVISLKESLKSKHFDLADKWLRGK